MAGFTTQARQRHPPSPPLRSSKQARFLGLRAFAHAASSAGQLLTFRIEHRRDSLGTLKPLRGSRGSQHVTVYGFCLPGPPQFSKEGPPALVGPGPSTRLGS